MKIFLKIVIFVFVLGQEEDLLKRMCITRFRIQMQPGDGRHAEGRPRFVAITMDICKGTQLSIR
jgi:hypothetical protein